jgi:23S rRNA pseudouridine2605 synthase
MLGGIGFERTGSRSPVASTSLGFGGTLDLLLPRRLDKFLADARIGSRVHIEALAQAGAIRFNGVVERTLQRLVDPLRDAVDVHERRAIIRPPRVYALLNKPSGVVTTLSDPRGRPCIAACIPPEWHGRVGVVGRLDKPTTGALLVTDDGDLSHLLTDPAFHVWKRYLLTVRGELSDADPRLAELRAGVEIGGKKTRPGRCGVVSGSGRPGRGDARLSDVWLEISEGRFRQVRRMANLVKLRLTRLHRVAIGPLGLEGLETGKWRQLIPAEIEALYGAAGGRNAPSAGAKRALIRRLAAGELEPADEQRVRRYLADV